MNPLVSIIIPIYNAESHLRETLQSVLNQSYRNYEVLLIDDGSTDGGVGICQEIIAVDKRFFLIKKKNGGVSSARNVGIGQATGKYLVFVDADDLLETSAIETFVLIAERKKTDAVFGGIRFDTFDRNSNIIAKRVRSTGWSKEIQESDWPAVFEELFDANYISSCCGKLYSKETLVKHGIRFDERLSSYEDYDFVLRFLKYAKAVFCDERSFYRYQRFESEESGSKRYNPNSATQMAIVSETTCVWYESIGVLNSQKKYSHIAGFYATAVGNIAQSPFGIRQRCAQLSELSHISVFNETLQNATDFTGLYPRSLVCAARDNRWARMIVLVGARNLIRKINPAL